MIISVYLAFAIQLISLALGVGLLCWGLQNRGAGVVLAKSFGGIILILAILSMLALANTLRTSMSQPMMMMQKPGPQMSGMMHKNGMQDKAHNNQKNGPNH